MVINCRKRDVITNLRLGCSVDFNNLIAAPPALKGNLERKNVPYPRSLDTLTSEE